MLNGFVFSKVQLVIRIFVHLSFRAIRKELMVAKEVYTLPVQLRDERKVVGWISEITGENPKGVLWRLREEYSDCGSNVRRAFLDAGLRPFEWT